MKAAIYTKYGPPYVVRITEFPKAIPKDNEVLVKVIASTVNRTDCGFRSANYFVSRFFSGLFKPKFQILGCEFSGIIEGIGVSVRKFKIGDKIFGYNDIKFGGHAEYLAVTENDAIATIPENLTFEEAAPISEGAHYALESIRASEIKSGQYALVYGASGAIGSSAVQLLKYFDINVTAVCNTKNIDMVKSLGVDEVIDYQTQDYTKTSTKFDFVFDAVGKSSFHKCKPLMKDKAVYISTELGKNGQNVFFALFAPILGSKKVLFPIPKTRKEDIEFLKTLVEESKFRPVIDRVYKFDDIIEAYKYVETGQKTGNVVLKISNN